MSEPGETNQHQLTEAGTRLYLTSKRVEAVGISPRMASPNNSLLPMAGFTLSGAKQRAKSKEQKRADYLLRYTRLYIFGCGGKGQK